ncbi:hypothetical protein SynBIOSE41_03748 [Synechococcus sp. BIOS-E4-1]|nr:hypothetical protein SynBIOSE41_03748 [Synechococcus sp. BIOS-E4-1]
MGAGFIRVQRGQISVFSCQVNRRFGILILMESHQFVVPAINPIFDVDLIQSSVRNNY